MSDLPVTDAPAPMWDPPQADFPKSNTDVAERLRSPLRRILVRAVVAVLVLGAAGVITATATNGSWAPLICLGVAFGCVTVALVAAARANAAIQKAALVPVAVPHRPRPVDSDPPMSGPSVSILPMSGPSVSGPPASDPPVSSPALSGPAMSGPPTFDPSMSGSLMSGPSMSHPSMFGDDPGQRGEVFGKLARRLQSLVNRAIQKVDGLEREIEDPELLRGLYEIDHLVTRVRRQSENLAVLGGGAPQRRSTTPVSTYAVLRSAVAEIEHYKQVTIVPLEGVSLKGHAVAEIIHLLAELLENATTFSSPDAPKVVVRAQRVAAGLAIEVQDRGLGMPVEDLQRINRLLDGTATIDLDDLLQDGRIGLAVVKELARRHNIRVQLQTNIFGGVDAAVVLPHFLLGDPEQDVGSVRHAQPAPQDDRTITMPAVTAMTSAPDIARGAHDSMAEHASVGPGHAQWVHTPGAAFAPLPSPAPAVAERATIEKQAPPPLPQRRGSHLRPELHEPPPPTTPLPGHDISLVATARKGFERGRDEQSDNTLPSQSYHGTTQGESTQWPTT